MNTVEQKQQEGGKVAELPFYVRNQIFRSKDQHLSGLEIKRMAGLPPEADLFLAVTPPWQDERIGNEDRVDLARTEIEHFYVKANLSYTLNGVAFDSRSQYIQGRRLRREGNIPETQDIYLAAPSPWEPELIEDDTFVDLARPGANQFLSKDIAYRLIVNAREDIWKKKKISYTEVVKLAFPNYVDKTEQVYTVTYKKGPVQNPEGSMVKGDTVFVKDKMLFHVTATDKS
jgi:hypothetical protein